MTNQKMNTRTMDPFEIRGADYNPRKRLKKGTRKYEQLRRSIEQFGLVAPLVWNERSVEQGWPKDDPGCLVGGHQRLQVIQELGWESVDVVVVDLPAAQEKTLNVALNRITGEWDRDRLSEVLTELEAAEDVNVEVTGFDGSELDRLLHEARREDPEYVFTEELLEEHNYVVLYFDNSMDWESAKDTLGVGSVHALDSRPGYERRGLGRVIRGDEVVRRLLAAEGRS